MNSLNMQMIRDGLVLSSVSRLRSSRWGGEWHGVQLEGWIKTAPAVTDGDVFRRKSMCTTFRAQHNAYICSDFGL